MTNYRRKHQLWRRPAKRRSWGILLLHLERAQKVSTYQIQPNNKDPKMAKFLLTSRSLLAIILKIFEFVQLSVTLRFFFLRRVTRKYFRRAVYWQNKLVRCIEEKQRGEVEGKCFHPQVNRSYFSSSLKYSFHATLSNFEHFNDCRSKRLL